MTMIQCWEYDGNRGYTWDISLEVFEINTPLEWMDFSIRFKLAAKRPKAGYYLLNAYPITDKVVKFYLTKDVVVRSPRFPDNFFVPVCGILIDIINKR
jgi:hypothetical protein